MMLFPRGARQRFTFENDAKCLRPVAIYSFALSGVLTCAKLVTTHTCTCWCMLLIVTQACMTMQCTEAA